MKRLIAALVFLSAVAGCGVSPVLRCEPNVVGDLYAHSYIVVMDVEGRLEKYYDGGLVFWQLVDDKGWRYVLRCNVSEGSDVDQYAIRAKMRLGLVLELSDRNYYVDLIQVFWIDWTKK